MGKHLMVLYRYYNSGEDYTTWFSSKKAAKAQLDKEELKYLKRVDVIDRAHLCRLLSTEP